MIGQSSRRWSSYTQTICFRCNIACSNKRYVSLEPGRSVFRARVDPSSKRNRPVLNCEKSRSDKSESRNASASSSVVSLGTRRFISLDLLGMHITSADGPNKAGPLSDPQSEGYEQSSSSGCPAYGYKPLLSK